MKSVGKTDILQFGAVNTKMNSHKKNFITEWIVKIVLFIFAIVAVLTVGFIFLFILREGLPVIMKVGLFKFVLGRDWTPLEKIYGILPMVVASGYVMVGSLLIGVPLGISCAIFLAEVAPPKFRRVTKMAIELLAGIPSVVYGFFGLVVVVPLMAKLFGNTGFSLLTGSIILAVMILPTIISISEDAIKAVPKEYKEGSLALGATHWHTIVKVLLPAARSGIVAAVVLGMGRAIGETMAVMMVTGNTPLVPHSLFDRGVTLTSAIGLEWSYSAGEHRQALFAAGIILFGVIMLLNTLINLRPGRQVK